MKTSPIIATILLVMTCRLICGDPTSSKTNTQSFVVSVPITSLSLPPAIAPTTVKTLQPVTNPDIAKINERLEKLENSNAATISSAIIAAAAGLGAALIGGLITLLVQRWTAKRELELAKMEAAFKNTEQIVEYRLKQLELFYGPMFAFLEQSKGLYIKMEHQLIYDHPDLYKELPTPDSDGYRVHVYDGTTWKGFRLLDQLPQVKSSKNAKVLLDQIMAIGVNMTALISQHSGLASSDIIELLGEYLEHFAILKSIYDSSLRKPYPAGWHKRGYFPRRLNKAIKTDYVQLNKILDDYSKAGQHALSFLQPA